jgi:hypothetical protein
VNRSASLTRLAGSYLDLRWHLDPIEASGHGVTAHDGRLGTYGDESVREHVAALRAMRAALEDLALDDRDDEIDRTALLNDAHVLIHRFTAECPQRRNPAFWASHALEGLYQLLVAADRPAGQRAASARARLEAMPGFFGEARATLHECPRVFLETGLAVVQAGLALVDDVGTAFAGVGTVDLTAPARAARAALETFAAELEAARHVAPTDGYAVGDDALNFRLAFQHAVRGTAVEVLRYGRHLTEEVEEQLAALASRLAPGVGWRDLAERLRETHPSPDALVERYAAAMHRARALVERLGLMTIPDGPLVVTPTPPYLRPVIPFAAYLPPGALSADRTGRFFVSAPTCATAEAELRDHCEYGIAATTVHEGYPGHHVHFLAAQSQPRLVRRVLTCPLTIEGWALYCEGMMGEAGFYECEEERFFQLVALLVRALRVVLDVGLHTGALPIDEAIRLARDRMGLAPAHAEAEVRRACAYPAYQLAYAVGRRELLALRDAYRARAGASFSLGAFHDAALAYGGLPVSLIRWGMRLDA